MNEELKAQLIEAAAADMELGSKIQQHTNPAEEYSKAAAAEHALKAFMNALTLHSVHELDAQPDGAVVIDRDGEPWQKLPNGEWIGEASTMREANTESSLQLEAWAPLFLVPTTGGRL